MDDPPMPRLPLLLLLALALAGCGDAGLNFTPIGDQPGTPPYTLFDFDHGTFTPTPYTRQEDATDAAADAVDTALLNTSAIGYGADSFGGQGSSALDSFVFVPLRSRAAGRKTTVELIDETDGDLHLVGQIRYDDADDSAPARVDLRATGPGVDLRLLVVADGDQLVIQMQGQDVDDGGRPVLLRYQSLLDFSGEVPVGTTNEEVRRLNGDLLYADESEFVGDPEQGSGLLSGRSIWVEPDGYWVRSQYDLISESAESFIGSLSFDASDGFGLDLIFTASDLFGQLRDTEGEPMALLALNQDGQLQMFDLEGQPMLDEQGQPIVFDLDDPQPVDSARGLRAVRGRLGRRER